MKVSRILPKELCQLLDSRNAIARTRGRLRFHRCWRRPPISLRLTNPARVAQSSGSDREIPPFQHSAGTKGKFFALAQIRTLAFQIYRSAGSWRRSNRCEAASIRGRGPVGAGVRDPGQCMLPSVIGGRKSRANRSADVGRRFVEPWPAEPRRTCAPNAGGNLRFDAALRSSMPPQ